MPRLAGAGRFVAWPHEGNVGGGLRGGAITTSGASIIAEGLMTHRELGGLSRSALRWVLAVGGLRRVGGISVELLSIEVRERGGRVLINTQSAPDRPEVVLMPLVRLADDLATPYHEHLSCLDTQSGVARWNLAFFPCPPAGAATLEIEITFPLDEAETTFFLGPDPARPGESARWRFPIPLFT